ncbi:uncharacterized protein LOC133305168 [Gastrolobium bilobum]|uniref:uncharacterized protein LOC133305168 n=1 Tax=Gastrolobium bilobum TaxID=150636 RepID=UPI002AB2C103|nr:uncharacterized protein LOC133305168 [Gastrolobium bilobum]
MWKKMALSDGKVAYKKNTQFIYDDGHHNHSYSESTWAEPKPSNQKKEFLHQFPSGAEDLFDGGFGLSDDSIIHSFSNMPPEVKLKNVLAGAFAILTGRNKTPRITADQQCPNLKLSFLGSGNNGDIVIDSSVYAPSAPPLFELNGIDYSAYKEVLEAEPPEWLPDSSAAVCMQCSAPFTALTRGRHHCRFCGGIFCRLCTKGRCLLPVRFKERNPQRVCDACYDRLDPLQGVFINTISNAVQVAKHDVMDWTCARGWLNLPIGLSMEHEIYKSSNTLRSYCQVARSNPERSIPLAILTGAKGLAILTVAKAGALLSYKLGTGLVVARRSDGSWSAPSAIFSLGLGWGAQIGGELMDFIVVLHDMKALKTFCSRMHFSLGAGCSAAAGPLGRVLEADIRAGDRGSGMCYTYSCSKGAFVGVSLEGNIVGTKMDANLRFYGDPYLTTSDILLGMVERPKAAEPLYAALQDLYSRLSC